MGLYSDAVLVDFDEVSRDETSSSDDLSSRIESAFKAKDVQPSSRNKPLMVTRFDDEPAFRPSDAIFNFNCRAVPVKVPFVVVMLRDRFRVAICEEGLSKRRHFICPPGCGSESHSVYQKW